MSDLISREWLLKQPLDTSNYPSNYVKSAPSAEIIECARAIQNHCDRTKCETCEFGREMFTGHINCALFVAKPYDWDLPESEDT